MNLGSEGAGTDAGGTSNDVLQGQSPGLGAAAGLGAAFELKYVLSPDDAARIEAWARGHLLPDRNGDNGRYRITSIYCDTPGLDVFHRSPGFRRTKFRVRRYNASERIFLERKRKRGDNVRKTRTEIDPTELTVLETPTTEIDREWSGAWFANRIRQRSLRPTCCVTYQRTAFFGLAGDMPVRLTFDRDLAGIEATGWQVPHLRSEDGHQLLPDGVLMEMKFHVHMPSLFQELLSLLPGQNARASKYRRCIQLCGIWTDPASVSPEASGYDPAGLALDSRDATRTSREIS